MNSPTNVAECSTPRGVYHIHTGTDATHAEHIETIKSRNYVGVQADGHFVPGELGMGLVEGLAPLLTRITILIAGREVWQANTVLTIFSASTLINAQLLHSILILARPIRCLALKRVYAIP